MEPSWFGVKTLFRSRAIGPPVVDESAFDSGVDCVEERTVLFRATGFANSADQ